MITEERPEPSQFMISVENLSVAASLHQDCYQVIQNTHGEILAVQNPPRVGHWLGKRVLPTDSPVSLLQLLWLLGKSKRNPKPPTTPVSLTTTTTTSPIPSCLLLGFQCKPKLLVTFPSCKPRMQSCFPPAHSTLCSIPRRASCKQLPLQLLPRKLWGPLHTPCVSPLLSPAGTVRQHQEK